MKLWIAAMRSQRDCENRA